MKKTPKQAIVNLPNEIGTRLSQLSGAPFVHLDTFCVAADEGLFAEPFEVFVFGGRLTKQTNIGLKILSGYVVGVVVVLHSLHSESWDVQALWQHGNSVDYYDNKLTTPGHAGLNSAIELEAQYIHHPPLWRRDSDSDPVWPTANHELMTFVEQLEVPMSKDERFRTFGGSYYFFARGDAKGRPVFKLVCQSS